MSLTALASSALSAFGQVAGSSSAPGVVSTSSNPTFSTGDFGISGKDQTMQLAILAFGVVLAIKFLR